MATEADGATGLQSESVVLEGPGGDYGVNAVEELDIKSDGAASDAALDSEIATGAGSAVGEEERGELEQILSEGSDEGWDTDVDIEEEKAEYDPTGAAAYHKCCETLGIVAVSHFLRNLQSQDSVVQLQHHGLGPKGAKAIAVALTSNTCVTQLNLTDCGLEVEGGIAISTMLKENLYITHLDLSDNNLGPPTAFAIADMLESNSTLVHLSLRGNALQDKSAVPLGNIISKSMQISYLDLSDNEFGEVAGELFGAALAESEVLHTLDLSWNHIRKKGAVALAAGLKNNQMLKILNLSGNGLGSEGAAALADCLKLNSTLEELDISNNRIQAEAAMPLTKVIPSCQALRILKIGKNPLQKVSAPQADGKPPPDPMAIIESLIEGAKASCLHSLDLSGVTVTLKVAESVMAMSESHPNLSVSHGGTGGYLRPKIQLTPVEKLVKYAAENSLNLEDLFHSFDKDQAHNLAEEEFKNALKHISAPLKEFERLKLIKQFSKTQPPTEEGGTEMIVIDYMALLKVVTEENLTIKMN